MKRHAIKVLAGLCLLLTAEAQFDDAIQQLPLSPLAVTRIPVAINSPTTVRFPSPVSDLEGAFVSADPKSPALFLISFRPGSSLFTVRALVPGTNTMLNVVWKDQTYVLDLVESSQPWFSVIFSPPGAIIPPAPRHPANSTRLPALLDTAKTFSLLKLQHPEVVSGVERVQPNTPAAHADFTITTTEVFRFETEDTLVFHVVLSNKTAQVIRYLPESLMVKAGERAYFQSINDADGLIAPQSAVPVFFAVTGTAYGGRNNLSPHTPFVVALKQLDSPAPAPVHSAIAPTNQPTPIARVVTHDPAAASPARNPAVIVPAPPQAIPAPRTLAAPAAQPVTVSVLVGNPAGASRPRYVTVQPAPPPSVAVQYWLPPPPPAPALAGYYYPATPVYYDYSAAPVGSQPAPSSSGWSFGFPGFKLISISYGH